MLYFGPTSDPTGFTSGETSGFDGSAEPVIRELIQNALDAAVQAKKSKASVKFVMDEIDWKDHPGAADYDAAFKKATRYRKSKGRDPSNDEKTTVKRIKSSIAKGASLPVLYCIDNGCGLDRQGMEALLSQGNTSKGADGAGSYGLGHLAAFSASDLRFVMYASRRKGATGEIEEICSGHAKLAAHESDGRLVSPNGFWLLPDAAQTAFVDYDRQCYPSDVPDMMREAMDSAGLRGRETGTAVMVSGFNGFRNDKSDTAALIAKAAAANFSAAIHSGFLDVTITDRVDKTADQVITKDRLEAILEQHRQQRRVPDGQAGHINGQRAYSAWAALDGGEQISTGVDGATAFVLTERHESSPQKPVVHLFRRGMWITSDWYHSSAAFSDCMPFEAALLIEPGSRVESLIRDAEGPKHLGIEPRRIAAKKAKELRELMWKIALSLKESADAKEDLQTHVVPGFAVFSGNMSSRKASPSTRRKRSKKEENGRKPNDDQTGRISAPKPAAAAPKDGARADYSHAVIMAYPENDASGSIVQAILNLGDDKSTGSILGIRLREDSGSDETCDNPVSGTWMRLIEADCDLDRVEIELSDEEEYEAQMKHPGKGTYVLTLRTISELVSPHLLELDVVRRKAPLAGFANLSADKEKDPS